MDEFSCRIVNTIWHREAFVKVNTLEDERNQMLFRYAEGQWSCLRVDVAIPIGFRYFFNVTMKFVWITYTSDLIIIH